MAVFLKCYPNVTLKYLCSSKEGSRGGKILVEMLVTKVVIRSLTSITHLNKIVPSIGRSMGGSSVFIVG